MTDEERDVMLREVHQAVLGVPGNPHENGLVGQCAVMIKDNEVMREDINEIKEEVGKNTSARERFEAVEKDIGKNTSARTATTWIGGAIFTALVALLLKVFTS